MLYGTRRVGWCMQRLQTAERACFIRAEELPPHCLGDVSMGVYRPEMGVGVEGRNDEGPSRLTQKRRDSPSGKRERERRRGLQRGAGRGFATESFSWLVASWDLLVLYTNVIFNVKHKYRVSGHTSTTRKRAGKSGDSKEGRCLRQPRKGAQRSYNKSKARSALPQAHGAATCAAAPCCHLSLLSPRLY